MAKQSRAGKISKRKRGYKHIEIRNVPLRRFTLNIGSDQDLKDVLPYFVNRYVAEGCITAFLKTQYATNACISQHIMHWRVENDVVSLKGIFRFLTDVQNCTSRFCVVRLTLYGDSDDAGLAHANIVIVDKLQGTVERYDPHHGAVDIMIDAKLVFLDGLLSVIFDNLFKYKYFDPLSYCPHIEIGLQDYEKQSDVVTYNNGLCVLWTLIYTEFRLTFADMPRDRVVQELLNKFEELSKTKQIGAYLQHFANRYQSLVLKAYPGQEEVFKSFYTMENDYRDGKVQPFSNLWYSLKSIFAGPHEQLSDIKYNESTQNWEFRRWEGSTFSWDVIKSLQNEISLLTPDSFF